MEFKNPEELRANMYTGNKEHDAAVSYAVLNKDIQFTDVIQESVQQNTSSVEGAPEDSSVESNTEQSPIEPSQEPNQQQIDPYYNELKQKDEYIKFIEEKTIAEKEELLRIKAELEEKLRLESEQKEDLARQIRERMQVEQNFTSTSKGVNDDDDEYVSDHSKKTRQMVIDLERKFGDNPDVRKLVAEFNTLKNEIDFEKKERSKRQQEEHQRSLKEAYFNDARGFFIKHPEIKPPRDLAEIDADVQRFRADIAHLSGAKTNADLEKAIDDFYNGGEFRTTAESRGIKPVDGYVEYNYYADLKDMAEGKKYNRTTGQYEEIKDGFGRPVRYRSVDEAYILSNYTKDISEAERNAYRKINRTLSIVNDAPATLSSSETAKVTNEMSAETIRELINLSPAIWSKDPVLKDRVEQAFRSQNLPLPTYRGR